MEGVRSLPPNAPLPCLKTPLVLLLILPLHPQLASTADLPALWAPESLLLCSQWFPAAAPSHAIQHHSPMMALGHQSCSYDGPQQVNYRK